MKKVKFRFLNIIFVLIIALLSFGFNSFAALKDDLNIDSCVQLNLKDNCRLQYLSECKKILAENEFDNLVNKIYNLTYNLNSSYPDYKKWFFEKLIKNIGNKKREIIFITDKNNDVIAMSALKNENNEKKICTLYIKENFRSLGFGSKLIEQSFKFLETTKPLITFSEEKLPMFNGFIKKYNWELYEKNDSYGNTYSELCYNGFLTHH